MIKIFLTVAVLGSMGSFAGRAIAQDKQGKAFSSDTFALLARLEAQCAHRQRTLPPDPRDDCVAKLQKLRSDAQIGNARGDAVASAAGPANGGGQGNGIGAGIGGGQGNGIGAGNGGGQGIGPGSGGGQGKGRR